MKTAFRILALALIASVPLTAQLSKAEELPKQLSNLEKLCSDKSVISCFNNAIAEPSGFVSKITDAMLVDHSPSYQCHIQYGLKLARLGDWKDTLVEITAALKDKPDLPDIIMLKAVAEAKTGDDSAALQDLIYLSKLRDERARGFKRSSDASNDMQNDELYHLLRDYGRLSELRAERANDYERTYEIYDHAISSCATIKAGQIIPSSTPTCPSERKR